MKASSFRNFVDSENSCGSMVVVATQKLYVQTQSIIYIQLHYCCKFFNCLVVLVHAQPSDIQTDSGVLVIDFRFFAFGDGTLKIIPFFLPSAMCSRKKCHIFLLLSFLSFLTFLYFLNLKDPKNLMKENERMNKFYDLYHA